MCDSNFKPHIIYKTGVPKDKERQEETDICIGNNWNISKFSAT